MGGKGSLKMDLALSSTGLLGDSREVWAIPAAIPMLVCRHLRNGELCIMTRTRRVGRVAYLPDLRMVAILPPRSFD
jgi:hypothetical protein